MKKIHLVSFNNPFPPDYGGVIDIFYKIKAFREAGISVILHVFDYNRPHSPELQTICEKVFYYPRKTSLISHFSFLPYIVFSRRSDELLANLCHDQFPVLFEGLHCCYYLDHSALSERIKLVRMHNIEHEYYSKLAESSRVLRDQLYFKLESIKLKRFERILKTANQILSISESDTGYFKSKYGNTSYIPAFHSNSSVSCLEGKGEFILIHGNLQVEENETAILYCIRNILNRINFPIVVTGKGPGEFLKKEIAQYPGIVLVENPDESEMESLQHKAHIHLCYTFQASGMKLKLLNSLYKGRFVVTNPLMIKGSGLEDLCRVGNDNQEIIGIINSLLDKAFPASEIDSRILKLEKFSNRTSLAKLLPLIN